MREELDSPELLEALAAAEHRRWAGWMKYQKRAPAAKVADWPRKTATPYAKLTELEKESDRIEARKFLAIIRAALDKARGEDMSHHGSCRPNDKSLVWQCGQCGMVKDAEMLLAELEALRRVEGESRTWVRQNELRHVWSEEQCRTKRALSALDEARGKED